jgi:AcrR family transcriptional regulator
MSRAATSAPSDEAGAQTRPVRRDVARNRQLLLDAARQVFAERGLLASLDDVAQAAGVGVATAYRHFANKYELASMVLDQEIDRMIRLAEEVAEMADPWTGITVFVTASVEAQVGNRALRDVLTGVHDEVAFQEVNARFNQPLNRLVDRARDAGLVRPDVRASDLGMLTTMLCAAGDLAREDHPALWRRYLPTLLRGLTPEVPTDEPALSDAAFRDSLNAHKRLTAGNRTRSPRGEA